MFKKTPSKSKKSVSRDREKKKNAHLGEPSSSSSNSSSIEKMQYAVSYRKVRLIFVIEYFLCVDYNRKR